MSKYNSSPAIIDGIRFDSKAEANYYACLKLAEKSGQISDLKIHPKYVIWQSGKEKITYVADFEYTENGKTVVEDVKGAITPIFRMKKKMFLAAYPDVDFREVKA